jgi:hypothetical protein
VDPSNNEQQCDVWERLRGCQCLIPALGNNSFWNWNKLPRHVTRPEGCTTYLPQDLFVSFYHPCCRSLWLSDGPKRIYRSNGCRCYVANRHFVVQLAIDCHFTPQVVWQPAHSAGCSAQQWTCNACSHYDWHSTVAIFVSFVVPCKELLRISGFRNLFRTGCSRLYNHHEQNQETYWVFSWVRRWHVKWINLNAFCKPLKSSELCWQMIGSAWNIGKEFYVFSE